MERRDFEELALAQMDAVYRLAFHLTHAADRAEDLVQEVYVRALRPATVAGFSSTGGGMRSWLFAICHNIFFSQYARDKRSPISGNELRDNEVKPDLIPTDIPTAWNRPGIDWEQVDDRLRLMVEELRPEYREVLLMWGIEGLKYREIATILGLPLGTVMSRLHRARATLAEQLGPGPANTDEINGRKTRRLNFWGAPLGLLLVFAQIAMHLTAGGGDMS